MVRMRRVLACGFAVVLMASFCSCSHGRSTAEKKTKNTKKEPVELKDDKSNWTDYDQVISYIENELGAVKTSYNDLTQEKWEQG